MCVSSAFNYEFMEQASTVALPAYLPADGHDVQVALTEIDHALRKKHPNRLGEKALMGYSIGALHSLYIAATAPTNAAPLIQFDRYVAINTPVRMTQGVVKLDEYYRAPLEWPVSERTQKIENTFLKVAALSKSTLTPQTSLPFNAIESKFLVGLTFRLLLRDIIFSSQRRNDLGVLHEPIRNWRRDPIYQEILQYSYSDYFEKFAIPYYQSRGIESPAREAIEAAGDLRTYEAELRGNPTIRVIVNQNDFLLPEDRPELARKHVSRKTIDRFPKRRAPGKSIQSRSAKDDFGIARGYEVSTLPNPSEPRVAGRERPQYAPEKT